MKKCSIIFDDNLECCTENLGSMEQHGKGSGPTVKPGAMEAHIAQSMRCGLTYEEAYKEALDTGYGGRWAPTNDAKAEDFKKRTEVAGAACDRCGVARGYTKTGRLKACSRCSLAYYRCKECQKAAWKAGHREACRKPGEIKVDDWMVLRDLE